MFGITPFIKADKALGPLRDKSVEIYKGSSRLEASVRPGLKDALTHLLRFVNSYYSHFGAN